MKNKLKNLKPKFNIDVHVVLHQKCLYEYHEHCSDEFYTDSDNTNSGFEYFLKIHKIWTLSGIYYRVEIPDMFVHDKNLFFAINECMKEMCNDSPRYYRLKEKLLANGMWKKL